MPNRSGGYYSNRGDRSRQARSSERGSEDSDHGCFGVILVASFSITSMLTAFVLSLIERYGS